MDIKNVKVGMKVKLLGKHAGFWSDYNNIEDWFNDNEGIDSVEKIKEQGYGVVTDINEDDEVWVVDGISNDEWAFLSSDLEPYEEEDVINKNNELNNIQQQIKTPKEWLLTPLSHFTVLKGDECITLGNGCSYIISNGEAWCSNLDEKYNEDLTYSNNYEFYDIIKITYEGKVVWERKEEIKKMTLKEIEKKLGYKITIVGE